MVGVAGGESNRGHYWGRTPHRMGGGRGESEGKIRWMITSWDMPWVSSPTEKLIM